MRQFVIAVFLLAFASTFVALASYPSGAPATAAESNDAPLDANSQFTQVKPAPGNGTGTDNGIYLPPVSSSHSEITGTVQAQQDEPAGPKDFIVGSVDAQGRKKFWHGLTDANGHFHFAVPAAIAGLAALVVFRHFNKDGVPDAGSDCQITDGPAHLPGATQLANVPPAGPAITEGYPVYEEGGHGQGLMQVLTRNGDPRASKLLLDGSDRGVDTLASSDRALVGKIQDGTQPGFYRASFASGSQHSNDLPTSIVRVTYDPIPTLKPGSTTMVRMHIQGIRPQDAAIVIFNVTGAAKLADGGTTASVPVKDDLAQVLIRGVTPGELNISTDLEVHQPEAQSQASELTPPPPQSETTPTKYPYFTTSRPTPTPKPSPLQTDTPRPGNNGGTTQGRDLTPPPGTEGRNTPGPGPSTTSKPTPTPPPTENPTPTPYPSPTATPTPCELRPWDGWFEPEQAVWQDDDTWKNKPVPHLVRVRDDIPHYTAELNMVTDKPSVIFGVNWYVDERGDIRQINKRDVVSIEIYTDCTEQVPVKMRFTGEAGVAGPEPIYESGVLAQIPIRGKAGSWQHYTVSLPVPTGVPENSTFTFLPDTNYRIVAQLIDDSGAPIEGAEVIVDGHAEVTHGPVIRYIPLLLSYDSSFYNAATKRDLTLRTITIAQDSHKYIPDFYAVKPWDLPTVVRELFNFTGKDLSETYSQAFDNFFAKHLANVSDANIEATKLIHAREKLEAAITDQLSTSGLIDGAGRTVAVLSDHDYFAVAPPNSLGITVSTKLILIPEFMNFQTVGHELTHSIPVASWSSAQMQAECGLDYHNTQNLIANGERITTASVLAARVRRDKTFPLMGASGKGPSPNTAIPANWPIAVANTQGAVDPEKWITECTYWHLLKDLTIVYDPPMLLVRGMLFHRADLNTAVFGPFYTLDGSADLTAGASATYSIVAYDADGKTLATYPFVPQWRLPDTKEDRSLIAFGYRIPLTPDLARVDVVGPGGVLASEQLSAQAPAIHITSVVARSLNAQNVVVEPIRPSSGGTVHVAWTVTPSTNALASVLYSSDGGKTWIDRVFEAKITSFDVLLEPHVHKHQVKVVVTNGTRSSSQVVKFSTQ